MPGSGRSSGGGHGNPLQCSCWRIPRTEKPDGLQSMGSQRVGHDWGDVACTHGDGKTSVVARDRGAWRATVCRVAKSQTRLNRLSTARLILSLIFVSQTISDLASGTSFKLTGGPFEMSSLCFEYFLYLWQNRVVHTCLLLFLPSPEIGDSFKDPGSLYRRITWRTGNVLITSRVLLLLDHFSGICVHTHMWKCTQHSWEYVLKFTSLFISASICI